MPKATTLLALLLGLSNLCADYEPGHFLALTIQKLEKGIDPPRNLRILAIGDDSLHALGDGGSLHKHLLPKFPHCPKIQLNLETTPSATWTHCLDRIREALAWNPDIVIAYATGNPTDLNKLLTQIRTQSTADILVPTIHWRTADLPNWERSENATDQDIAVLRETCRRHGAGTVENRKRWAAHLQQQSASIKSLLQDASRPNPAGLALLRQHILAHFQRPAKGFHYEPRTRERRLNFFFEFELDDYFEQPFTGNRITLLGRKSPQGGTARIVIDGKPAGNLSFAGPKGETFREEIKTSLDNKRHNLRIFPAPGTALGLRGIEVFEPPLHPPAPNTQP